jgi:cytoskeletal protein CcmA (bactofilin family)
VGYFSQNKPNDKTSHGSQANGAGGEVRTTGAAAASTGKKAPADIVSMLGPDMTITGNVVCEGSTQILGRVIGDVQAAQVIIGEGAEVEGNVTAHDVTVNGSFKGTIRSHNVKLKGTAMVDGEVFSKSLTVEENVQFEGVSRRLDKPIELQPAPQPAAPAMPTADSAPIVQFSNASIPVPVV